MDAFVVATALEFGTAVIATGDPDDMARLSSPLAQLRYEVGATGEKCHLGCAGKVIEYIAQISRDVDAHEGIMAFVLGAGRLA